MSAVEVSNKLLSTDLNIARLGQEASSELILRSDDALVWSIRYKEEERVRFRATLVPKGEETSVALAVEIAEGHGSQSEARLMGDKRYYSFLFGIFAENIDSTLSERAFDQIRAEENIVPATAEEDRQLAEQMDKAGVEADRRTRETIARAYSDEDPVDWATESKQAQ